MIRNKIFALMSIMILISLTFGSVSAVVDTQTPTVCCEKTTSGLFCQNVPESQCAADAKKVATSCDATSFCKPGTCFDSTEGTCLDNTPQNVCNQNGGIWTDKEAPQCQLGCCVIGDQAAFVTQTRCKKLSSVLGLQTNYKMDIKDEVSCIASVLGQDKGACVFDSEFQKTCRVTTRADCAGGVGGTGTKGEFFKGKLCSAEELGTNCGLTTKTECVPGKEGVYFVDSCGNVANIYDASKAKDKEYWTDMKDPSESCNPGAANAKNAQCGNCNYLQGSICRASSSTTGTPTYGDNICADLNCKATSDGNSYKHGESWCVYSDAGKPSDGNNAVGSQFFKHICIDGEEVVEACADYRQQVCIQDKITYSGGTFSQAACRVNRWQDCSAQKVKEDCENGDKRDCRWITGKCVPAVAPGLQFWTAQNDKGTDAQTICAQASTQCTAVSSKGLFSDKSWSGDCVNTDGSIKLSWLSNQAAICHAVGDCVIANGSNANLVPDKRTNWIGQIGSSGA